MTGMGNIIAPGGSGIPDQILINNGFYFVEKDVYTGRKMWYYKDEIMINSGLGIKGPSFVFDPFKQEIISNNGGDFGTTRRIIVSEEQLQDFIATF